MRPERSFSGSRVMARLVEAQAAALGDSDAIVIQSRALSYEDLARFASRFATGLRELGIRPGDRVATMADGTTPDYFAAWFGSAWGGAVEIPINTETKGDSLAHVISESDPAVLVIGSEYLSRLSTLQLPSEMKIVAIGKTAPDTGLDTVDFTELMSCGESAPADSAESDPLCILYTSGSTGRPKGAVHTNGSMMTHMKGAADAMRLSPADVSYCYFPLFHITGRGFGVGAPMWTGGRAHVTKRFSATTFWRDVAAADATWTVAVGGILQLLDARDPSPPDRLHRLRLIVSGRVPPELASRFEERFGLELLDMYGLTETGTVSGQRVGEPKQPGWVGRAFPHLEVEIHDEGDNPVEAGSAGEVCVRPLVPNAIFSGYWRQPEATLEAIRNLWFHTGDAGLLDADGHLKIVDRLKDSIRRLGENISAFEVESAVNQHPDVLESAAYPAKPGTGDEEVMVSVVLRAGCSLEPDSFVAFCDDRLPRFAIPRFVRILDALPKNHSHRVEKFRLREEGITSTTLDLREQVSARKRTR